MYFIGIKIVQPKQSVFESGVSPVSLMLTGEKITFKKGLIKTFKFSSLAFICVTVTITMNYNVLIITQVLVLYW